MKLSEAEWSVLDALWEKKEASLKELTDALRDKKNWNKKTVFTYLTRMEGKGLVLIDRSKEKPYSAAITKETCARQEREELCSKVYGGATGEMLAAFLKESTISKEEINRLKKLLDEMEV